MYGGGWHAMVKTSQYLYVKSECVVLLLKDNNFRQLRNPLLAEYQVIY